MITYLLYVISCDRNNQGGADNKEMSELSSRSGTQEKEYPQVLRLKLELISKVSKISCVLIDFN